MGLKDLKEEFGANEIKEAQRKRQEIEEKQQREKEELDRKINEALSRLGTLRTDLENSINEVAEKAGQISEHESNKNTNVQKIAQLENQIKQIDQELSSLADKIKSNVTSISLHNISLESFVDQQAEKNQELNVKKIELDDVSNKILILEKKKSDLELIKSRILELDEEHQNLVKEYRSQIGKEGNEGVFSDFYALPDNIKNPVKLLVSALEFRKKELINQRQQYDEETEIGHIKNSARERLSRLQDNLSGIDNQKVIDKLKHLIDLNINEVLQTPPAGQKNNYGLTPEQIASIKFYKSFILDEADIRSSNTSEKEEDEDNRNLSADYTKRLEHPSYKRLRQIGEELKILRGESKKIETEIGINTNEFVGQKESIQKAIKYLEEEIKSQTANLNNINSTIRNLKSVITDLGSKFDSTNDLIEKLVSSNDELTIQITEKETAKQGKTAEIGELQDINIKIEITIEELRNQIEEIKATIANLENVEIPQAEREYGKLIESTPQGKLLSEEKRKQEEEIPANEALESFNYIINGFISINNISSIFSAQIDTPHEAEFVKKYNLLSPEKKKELLSKMAILVKQKGIVFAILKENPSIHSNGLFDSKITYFDIDNKKYELHTHEGLLKFFETLEQVSQKIENYETGLQDLKNRVNNMRGGFFNDFTKIPEIFNDIEEEKAKNKLSAFAGILATGGGLKFYDSISELSTDFSNLQNQLYEALFNETNGGFYTYLMSGERTLNIEKANQIFDFLEKLQKVFKNQKEEIKEWFIDKLNFKIEFNGNPKINVPDIYGYDHKQLLTDFCNDFGVEIPENPSFNFKYHGKGSEIRDFNWSNYGLPAEGFNPGSDLPGRRPEFKDPNELKEFIKKITDKTVGISDRYSLNEKNIMAQLEGKIDQKAPFYEKKSLLKEVFPSLEEYQLQSDSLLKVLANYKNYYNFINDKESPVNFSFKAFDYLIDKLNLLEGYKEEIFGLKVIPDPEDSMKYLFFKNGDDSFDELSNLLDEKKKLKSNEVVLLRNVLEREGDIDVISGLIKADRDILAYLQKEGLQAKPLSDWTSEDVKKLIAFPKPKLNIFSTQRNEFFKFLEGLVPKFDDKNKQNQANLDNLENNINQLLGAARNMNRSDELIKQVQELSSEYLKDLNNAIKDSTVLALDKNQLDNPLGFVKEILGKAQKLQKFYNLVNPGV